jgi:hypothetical protein
MYIEPYTNIIVKVNLVSIRSLAHSGPFIHDLILVFSTRVTRWVPHVEQARTKQKPMCLY